MGKGSPAWNDPLEGSRRGRERIALEEAVAAAALAATLMCTIAVRCVVVMPSDRVKVEVATNSVKIVRVVARVA